MRVHGLKSPGNDESTARRRVDVRVPPCTVGHALHRRRSGKVAYGAHARSCPGLADCDGDRPGRRHRTTGTRQRISTWCGLGAGDRAAQLESLSELRRGFEPVAAALAARRADPHQCRIMAAAVSDMVVHGRSGDLESYLLADKIFHRTLLEASGNEMFRALTDVVAEVLSGRTHHGMMPERPNTAAIALHDEVARAIRLQDEVAAEKAMRAIIDEAAAAVTEEFGGAEQSTSSPPSDD